MERLLSFAITTSIAHCGGLLARRLKKLRKTIKNALLETIDNFWEMALAKHLTDMDIERIVELLDGWTEKLGWEALCDACLPAIGFKPVRQTLMKFARIKGAFIAAKKRIKQGIKELPSPPSMRIAIERIARLERENERLKRENRELLQQFVVWQYNAHIHGLSDRELKRPLPIIDRGQTN